MNWPDPFVTRIRLTGTPGPAEWKVEVPRIAVTDLSKMVDVKDIDVIVWLEGLVWQVPVRVQRSAKKTRQKPGGLEVQVG